VGGSTAQVKELAPAHRSKQRQEGIDPGRQLMITDLRVVEDPVRTNPDSGRQATWTFKYLVENMAGAHDPAEFVLRWLELWEQDQTVNGHVAEARPSIRELVIDPWMAASGGHRLDLTKAPFKLLAIVNRMDLRVHVEEEVFTAGEGRFVFGLLTPDGLPLPPSAGTVPGGFTVIFEYELIAQSMRELGEWTMLWRDLKQFHLGSRDYNSALERVTRRFTDHGRAGGKPNGSALNQIRSNEIALAIPWELREFVIDGQVGWLRPETVALTPDTIELNGTPAFTEFINTYGAEIMQGTAQLDPEAFGASSLSGPFQPSDFPDFESRTFTTNPLIGPFSDIPWSAAGIVDNDARHAFALNTCNGCHRDETGTAFLQVGFPPDHDLPRTLASPAALAAFLTGTEVPDPVDADTIRSFNDLDRRKQDLEALIATFGAASDGPGPRGRHVPLFVH